MTEEPHYPSATEPTGLSVVGRTYGDVTAFRVAAALEERFRLLDAPERRPSL